MFGSIISNHNILSTIIIYLDIISLNSLCLVSTYAKPTIDKVKDSNLYWEKRTKLLISMGKHMAKNTSFLVIISAANCGCEKTIKFLMNIPIFINPLYVANIAIKIAAKRGHLNIVKMLLENPIGQEIHPKNLSRALINSILRDKISLEIVRLLINNDRINIGDYSNRAIILASSKGYLDIVKLLVEKLRISYDLRIIEHLNIVKLSLKNIPNGLFCAFITAFDNEQFEIINFLLTLPEMNSIKKFYII